MRRRRPTSSTSKPRSGTVLVENALVISTFAIFLAGIMEFGHCYMVVATLNTVAKRGARHGSVEKVTTTDVRNHCNALLNKSFKSAKATILVKDAGVFDTSNPNTSNINYDTLPNLELSTAASRQLYIVRITVPYKDISLLPPFWAKTLTLHGQSVMRHE